jgi:hypothetical protein
LRLADEDHPLFLAEAAQVLGHHLVFALSLVEPHQRHRMPRHKGFQRCHEAPAHRAHQSGRWEWLATVVPEKPHNALLRLQPRHIDVEVHPVDPRDRQLHMMAEDIGHALCYHSPGSGRAGFALEAL